MVEGLKEFTQGISGIAQWQHTQKIKFFAWYIHSRVGSDRFNQAEIRACYDALHLEKPSDVSAYLTPLMTKKPAEVIRDKQGYYLERRVRDQFEAKYGQRLAAVQVDKLLQTLPNQVPNLTERTFLNEAIACFKVGAFRAAIVMCWNLAFDHLCKWVFKNHLATFNAQLPKSYPKARINTITREDDFTELKEFEVLQVCRSANIISGDIYKILNEKLGRRNSAAHPSNVVFSQVQAEDFITDLVNNVVIKLL